ncbi:hypothetical protein IM538_03110 [Cytobacillus suaedae]|nr:hypothetical protein IM538_03110 [Cytobacillus suaedae]
MNENLKAALNTLEKHHQNVKQDINHWLNHEFLTWNWWFLVAFILIPLVIWIKVVDRKRILEIMFVWTLVIIPTSYLDAIGVDLKFWVYPVQFVPITPRALPFDVFMVGVTFMLLYQYFSTWRSYLIALFIMALLFAFIGEPISKRLNLVYYIKWKYHFSFFYYVLLGVTVRAIVLKCKKLSENK